MEKTIKRWPLVDWVNLAAFCGIFATVLIMPLYLGNKIDNLRIDLNKEVREITQKMDQRDIDYRAEMGKRDAEYRTEMARQDTEFKAHMRYYHHE